MATAPSMRWNVYLPVNVLGDSTVFLTGHIDETALSVYITNTVKSERTSIIGEFLVSKTSTGNQRAPPSQQRNVWLSINKSSRNVLQSQLYLAGKDSPCRCVTVLCEPRDLESSFVFADEENKCADTIGTIVPRLLRAYSYSAGRGQKHKNNHVKKRRSRIEQTFSYFLEILIVTFAFIESFLRLVTFKWFWSQICIQQVPSIINNITYKLNRFRRIEVLISSNHKSKQILYDSCGQQVLDTALGVGVMLWVMSGGHADLIAASLMNWAVDTAHYLHDLLHSLMGAPAGLKLNAQLTQYMGHFFLYHVYLWSGYLSILRPVLGWIIWTAASFGMLGLTTQLCLVQDIISMMTLHIYCFYVYAARLYKLQIHALSSLWRLFRGKKWNVLRLRVDSALYTIDQLCVGTLLFTVLLFLLPTSLLYYTVFTALRLVVVSFHGMLTAMIDVLNLVPAVTVLLRMARSKCVAGNLLFTVLQDAGCMESDGCLTLSMKVIQLPLPQLYRRAQRLMKTESLHQEPEKYSWTELLRRVISGKLIYPWVNHISSDSKDKEL